MKPTEKQKRFVDEYLKDLNASAAARRAGYSVKTADRIGPELLGKTCVSKLIAERIQKRQQRTEITQDFVLTNLKEIVQRSMQHEGADEYDPRAAAKALELLGKHLGMFTDKIKLEGELTVSGILDELVKRKEAG
ncbi:MULTISPECIES: terminase small subunit [Pyramidobacter]|uniref:terminase small subunit n=1 Tax=Pyramidobacter TaxID=638847 RepID=UPI001FCBC659|nr:MULTISPECIES: terminase small subunit [Pyramidobacter]WOL39598.1 terminase small subunit [Pyramidobacter sp. YE332]BDF78375.1 hypothetical protein CE91St28_11690 [Pyramidobacter piscolens]